MQKHSLLMQDMLIKEKLKKLLEENEDGIGVPIATANTVK